MQAHSLAFSVALGVTLALSGCSGASPGSGDDDVGSPGGAFVPPHADAAPEEGGVEYDAEVARESGVADAAPPRDARPADAEAFEASTHDAAPTGCVSMAIPADAGAFAGTLPIVVPLAGGDAGAACGAGYITAFYDACIGSAATAAACNDWAQGGAGSLAQENCASCLEGVNPGGGAFVYANPSEPRELTANQVACVLAADPSPAGVSCARSLLDLEECEATSCASCTSDGMGGGTDPDGLELYSCETVADQGACAGYVAEADSACPDLDPGGAAAACAIMSGASFEEVFLAYGTVLCGGS